MFHIAHSTYIVQDVYKRQSTQLDEVIHSAALEKLKDTPTETTDTRADAALVIDAIENFNIVSLLFSGQKMCIRDRCTVLQLG